MEKKLGPETSIRGLMKRIELDMSSTMLAGIPLVVAVATASLAAHERIRYSPNSPIEEFMLLDGMTKWRSWLMRTLTTGLLPPDITSLRLFKAGLRDLETRAEYTPFTRFSFLIATRLAGFQQNLRIASAPCQLVLAYCGTPPSAVSRNSKSEPLNLNLPRDVHQAVQRARWGQ